MANRTIQFLGLAYGSTPANMQVTADGSAVFSGNLTTLDQPVPRLPDATLIDTTYSLFSLELDTSFSGNVNVSCQVNNGVVIFAQMRYNYASIPNPLYSPEQIDVLSTMSGHRAEKVAIYESVEAVPPLSAEDIALLNNPSTPYEQIAAIVDAHGLQTVINGGAGAWQEMINDPRSSVEIDNVIQIPNRDPDSTATWWWKVSAGSTLTFTLQVPNISPAP